MLPGYVQTIAEGPAALSGLTVENHGAIYVRSEQYSSKSRNNGTVVFSIQAMLGPAQRPGYLYFSDYLRKPPLVISTLRHVRVTFAKSGYRILLTLY